MATRHATQPIKSDSAGNLKFLCSSLLQERDQLHAAMVKLRAENDQLKRILGDLLCDDIEIDKRALLAHFGKEPSLADLIAEFESAGG